MMDELSLITEFERGDQVLYIPMHAEGDPNHPDCEKGFVTSANGSFVFVRYFMKDLRYPNELRTKANSEATPAARLIKQKHHSVRLIEALLEEYCQPV